MIRVTIPPLLRPGETAVLLPGTGSDEVFVTAVFAEPLAAAGMRLVAPRPNPGPDLVRDEFAALDEAADRYGPIVAGGISLGAHIAAEWAATRPRHCVGLLLAMPGWSGPAGEAPGSVTARLSAEAVDAHGIDKALAEATRDVPAWLAAELDRAWRRAGAGLAASLRAAVGRPAPTPELLARITVPAGVTGCVDDPVHPFDVARTWAAALPAGELRSITFDELGADPATLGRRTLAGLHVRMPLRVHDQVGDTDPDDDAGGGTALHQR
jgi:pimeloyl-ACP methyl ester carboxylesterase